MQSKTPTTAQEIIDFWVDDVGPKGWYEADDAVDDTIRTQFGEMHKRASEGKLSEFQDTAQGALALLILLDQFSRNMFRGDAKSFAADPLAREIARLAIERDYDLEIEGPEQQFFYLPFTHSEDLSDQDYGVELGRTRYAHNTDDALHARAHREIIRKFGRFPFRNEALGRESSPAEKAFMQEGGYRSIVNELQSENAE